MSLTVSTDLTASRPAAGGPPGSPAPPAIQTRDLRKEYGSRVALHGLSLTVEPGEVFGFLGPNGAGKTTTIKILLGLVRASSGQAFISGQSVEHYETRKQVGYLPENFRFQEWMTGWQLLDIHGRLAHMSGSDRARQIPQVLRKVGLEDRASERIAGYSKGMTQRIGLAQAILNQPRLVLLDEPTSALDPLGRREVRDLIRTLRDEGTTVFLNSHLLSEIELVCDRVAIVDRGRVVREGPLADMLGGLAQLRVHLNRMDDHARRLLSAFGRIEAVTDETALLSVSDLSVTPTIAERLVASGYQIFALVPIQQSLEDLFVTLVHSNER